MFDVRSKYFSLTALSGFSAFIFTNILCFYWNKIQAMVLMGDTAQNYQCDALTFPPVPNFSFYSRNSLSLFV